MKFHFKVVGLALAAVVVFYMSVSFWGRCDMERRDGLDSLHSSTLTANSPQVAGIDAPLQPEPPNGPESTAFDFLPCIINDDFPVDCIKEKESSQVFIPFAFINRYFEISGELERRDGKEVFNWQHSHANVYKPPGRYTPQGVFMSFEHYNVEIRDRVKCISGIEGVPLSTQWGPQGYFYPIQIAQYGLSHYSKYLVDKSRTATVLEDAQDGSTERWTVAAPGGSKTKVKVVRDPEAMSNVIEFDTTENWQDAGAKLQINSITDFHLSLDFKFATNGSFAVYVQPKGKRAEKYCIRYVLSQTLVATEGDLTIIIGIGERTRWSHITRDLAVDFQKGINVMYSDKNKAQKPRLVLHKVLSVVFHGQGWADNITLASNAHLAQFYYAANWLVLHQDDQGGWPIMVTRKITKDIPELPPGWYSAMAQGQAMSLLVRAYIRTQNHKYLDAALKATTLYTIPSSKGGVMAKFADKFVWYEEYPTTPSSFVLNGFIYSLVGLYDLKMVSPTDKAALATELYDAGMTSLRTLLPLYDTGSGSVYDLRHVALGTAPNLARWDYHATHINQLLLLATIQDDSESRAFYERTAQRWIGYMHGRRAAHN